MFGKKIGRRELFKLLPGGVLAALAGVSAAMAAGDEVETIQMKLEIDSAQLAEAVWDAPLEAVADKGDTTNHGSLTWICGEDITCPDCGMVGGPEEYYVWKEDESA